MILRKRLVLVNNPSKYQLTFNFEDSFLFWNANELRSRKQLNTIQLISLSLTSFYAIQITSKVLKQWKKNNT